MATLSQAKTLGGVGSLLVLLMVVPTAGIVLAIVGWIMTLIAVKYLSDVLADRSVFNNILIAVILAIIGIVVGGLVVFGSVLSFMGLPNITAGAPPSNVFGLVAGIIAGLAVMWIVFIVAAYFQRKSYSEVARRLNVGMFGTAALIFLIGAALLIVIIGFVLLFIAQILFVVAFFSIPETAIPTGTTGPPPPMPPTTSGTPSQGTKFCPSCGASLAKDATFCTKCGASQPAS